MIIGYTTGVFDMFHIGHLNILRRAKERCDFLIVGVSTDELVKEYKHKTPVIPLEQRLEIVRAIRYVDSAVRQDSRDKFAAYKEFGFQRLFVGSDWKGTEFWNDVEKQLAPFGVEIAYLQYTEGISSTKLRESIKKEDLLPPGLITGGGY